MKLLVKDMGERTRGNVLLLPNRKFARRYQHYRCIIFALVIEDIRPDEMQEGVAIICPSSTLLNLRKCGGWADAIGNAMVESRMCTSTPPMPVSTTGLPGLIGS